MKSLYEIAPIGKYRIWGGSALAKHLHLKEEHIGEVFCASALAEDDSYLPGLNTTLSRFYMEHGDFFQLPSPIFPLRVNLIDAQDSLSLQVHPKTQAEAWYVLRDDGHILLGHTFEDQASFLEAVTNDTLLHGCIRHSVQKDDFYYLPGGSLHAILKNTLVYEITQASDVTYRLYDYHRMDPQTGKERALRCEEAAAVLSYPQLMSRPSPCILERTSAYEKTLLHDEKQKFTLYRFHITGHVEIPNAAFYLITILEGSGSINGEEVKPYQTWMHAHGTLLHMEGTMTLMAATYR